jgi:hypothetical protein
MHSFNAILEAALSKFAVLRHRKKHTPSACFLRKASKSDSRQLLDAERARLLRILADALLPSLSWHSTCQVPDHVATRRATQLTAAPYHTANTSWCFKPGCILAMYGSRVCLCVCVIQVHQTYLPRMMLVMCKPTLCIMDDVVKPRTQ